MARRRLEKQGSQQDTVKAALLAGMRLNQPMMLKLYGGDKAWRLGGIIWSLERDENDPLVIDRHYSGTNRMATYWLSKGDKSAGAQQLGLPL